MALVDQLIPTVWNSTRFFNFGYVDVILWKLPVYLLTGIFGVLGFDYNVAEKFIVFWPVVFGLAFSSFFLCRHILKSNFSAFIGSLVFSFNTYFLSINSQGHQFLPASFALSTFTILSFIKLAESPKLIFSIITALLMFLTGAYDFRSLYITLFVLIGYLFYYLFINYYDLRTRFLYDLRTRFLTYLFFTILPFFLLIILSFYWILPILFTGSFSNNPILGRQIFGSEFYNLQSSITTFFPFWTGKQTAWFTIQSLPIYFWVYPVLAIIGLLVAKRNYNILFFGLIALAGIFLSKQADIPFPQFYSWLYLNFPGFSGFREASKFDYLVSLGYAVLIASFVAYLISSQFGKNKKYVLYFLIGIPSLIFIWNAKPILTGEIKQLYVPVKLSKEYIVVKNLILKDPNYFRTFWVNMSLHWPPFNSNHPEIEGALILNSEWHPFVKENFENKKKQEGEKIVNSMKTDKMNRLLDMASVKYVIVPLEDKETQSNIISYFGKDHDYYKNELLKIPYLKLKAGMPENILVFENEGFKQHLYTTYEEEAINKDVHSDFVEHAQVNPSHYSVKIRNAREPIWLNFTENYHPSWGIKAGSFDPWKVITSKDYLADVDHKKNILGFNSFLIDPEKICKHNTCKKNINGTYDINLTLYFSPQSYLYLGMLISGSSLFLSAMYLFFYGITKIKK